MEPQDCVASPDVPVAILQKKILSAKSSEERERFENELQKHVQTKELVRDSMHKIVEKSTDSAQQAQQVLNAKSTAYTSKTYKEVVEYFTAKCFDSHDQKYEMALHHLYLFSNLIGEKVPVERIKAAIDEVCATLKEQKS